MRAVLWSLVVAAVGTAWLAAAQAPQIEVSVIPAVAVLGTPLTATVMLTNAGQSAVLVPLENHVLTVFRWQVGEQEGIDPAPPGMTHSGRPTLEALAAGASRRYRIPWWAMPRPVKAGTYHMRASVDLLRWVEGGEGAWSAAAGPVTVVVSEPEGEDREAYERYGGAPMYARDLLKEFPTSTYAAYRIRERGGGVMSGNQLDALVQQLGRGIEGCGELWVPCDRPCDEPAGLMMLHGRDVLTWREKWFNLVLQAHPDIWFADEMRLRLALDRYIAGDVPGAVAGMEALGTGGRAEVAAKAREVLALLRARGMIR